MFTAVSSQMGRTKGDRSKSMTRKDLKILPCGIKGKEWRDEIFTEVQHVEVYV